MTEIIQKRFIDKVIHEIRENLTLSLPLATSQIVYAFSGFIGTAFVARLGEDALAASVLVFTIWLTVSMFFFGLINAVSILVAQQHGARNKEAISDIMGQAILLGIFLCIPIVLILLSIPFVLQFTSQPPEVLAIAKKYLYSLTLMTPSLIMLIILEQFLLGINRAKLVLRISLIVVPIEIPLIYFFIFGKFGFPACGVAGIGYGFLTTYSLTTLFLALYLYKSKKFAQYHIFYGMRSLQFKFIKELLRVGVPIGFLEMIEIGAFAVMSFWIAKFGTTILAAHQIVLQFFGFFFATFFAMSQAVTVRVGHEVGRQNKPGIYYAIAVGLALSIVTASIIAILYLLFPDLLLSFDINVHHPDNSQLLQDAKHLLMISTVLIVFDNFRIVSLGALRGLKDTSFPMYISLFSFWFIGLPLAYLFGFYLQGDGAGIWWGMILGIIIGLILTLFRIKKRLQGIDLNKIMTIKSS